MYRIFIHLSVDGHLDCFYVLAIVNSAAMNIGVHVSFQIRVFSRYIPRTGIAGSHGNSMLSFLKASAHYFWASLVAQLVKNLPALWETWIQSLGWEDALEKVKATSASVLPMNILAWKIP